MNQLRCSYRLITVMASSSPRKRCDATKCCEPTVTSSPDFASILRTQSELGPNPLPPQPRDLLSGSRRLPRRFDALSQCSGQSESRVRNAFPIANRVGSGRGKRSANEVPREALALYHPHILPAPLLLSEASDREGHTVKFVGSPCAVLFKRHCRKEPGRRSWSPSHQRFPFSYAS